MAAATSLWCRPSTILLTTLSQFFTDTFWLCIFSLVFCGLKVHSFSYCIWISSVVERRALLALDSDRCLANSNKRWHRSVLPDSLRIVLRGLLTEGLNVHYFSSFWSLSFSWIYNRDLVTLWGMSDAPATPLINLVLCIPLIFAFCFIL
jgi:hypothetical protein